MEADLLESTLRYSDAFSEEIEALIEDNLRVAEELERELDLVVRERSAPEDPGDGGPGKP